MGRFLQLLFITEKNEFVKSVNMFFSQKILTVGKENRRRPGRRQNQYLSGASLVFIHTLYALFGIFHFINTGTGSYYNSHTVLIFCLQEPASPAQVQTVVLKI